MASNKTDVLLYYFYICTYFDYILSSVLDTIIVLIKDIVILYKPKNNFFCDLYLIWFCLYLYRHMCRTVENKSKIN